MNTLNYKQAGVDIEKGDAFVEKIKSRLNLQYQDRVFSGIGGFAVLYKITEDKLIAASTDGVGTKLKIAQQLNKHGTIGIDLVAMCVNDLLCVGAKPLFFMDYLAMGKLELPISEAIVGGIQEGCNQSHIPLIGGETAEMPDVYPVGEYDLAGFAIGEVMRKDVIDGSQIKEGDSIIALPASGLHSNGFSLARKVVQSDEINLLEAMLTPTRIYTTIINALLDVHHKAIHGLANITGGGIHNISRSNQNFDYHLTDLPKPGSIAPIFDVMLERSGLANTELYKTFNMGIGFCIITDHADAVLSTLSQLGESAYHIGSVVKGAGEVRILNNQ